jgi:pSer/pThr/pTyr-binding forkhead associated (FHA) protein
MHLIVLDGAAAKPRYDLSGVSFLIGRAPDCDIVINDQEASRHHARISRVGERYTIEDAQAANPTILNGRILTEPRPLHDGDVIVIGSVMLQVNLASDAEAPKPRPGSKRTRSNPSLRRAVAQRPQQSASPNRGRPSVSENQPPRSPTHELRDVAGRLGSACNRLRRLASRQPGTGRPERELGVEQIHARLDTILAQQDMLGGQPALERLNGLLPDPRSNETNMRELYRLGRAAPELATAARLAQQLLTLGPELSDVLVGAEV